MYLLIIYKKIIMISLPKKIQEFIISTLTHKIIIN